MKGSEEIAKLAHVTRVDVLRANGGQSRANGEQAYQALGLAVCALIEALGIAVEVLENNEGNEHEKHVLHDRTTRA